MDDVNVTLVDEELKEWTVPQQDLLEFLGRTADLASVQDLPLHLDTEMPLSLKVLARGSTIISLGKHRYFDFLLHCIYYVKYGSVFSAGDPVFKLFHFPLYYITFSVMKGMYSIFLLSKETKSHRV